MLQLQQGFLLFNFSKSDSFLHRCCCEHFLSALLLVAAICRCCVACQRVVTAQGLIISPFSTVIHTYKHINTYMNRCIWSNQMSVQRCPTCHVATFAGVNVRNHFYVCACFLRCICDVVLKRNCRKHKNIFHKNTKNNKKLQQRPSHVTQHMLLKAAASV